MFINTVKLLGFNLAQLHTFKEYHELSFSRGTKYYTSKTFSKCIAQMHFLKWHSKADHHQMTKKKEFLSKVCNS